MYSHKHFRFTLLLLIAVLGATTYSQPAMAQRLIQAEAFTGQPFGVGRIAVELSPQMLPQPLGVDGLGLGEAHGRVFYPALDTPAVGKVLKEVLDRRTPLTTGGPVRAEVGGLLRGLLDRPPRTTIYFLFKGDQPLDLTLQARTNIPLRIVPRNNPIAQQRLLALWWQQYAKSPGLLEKKPDYPPLVNNYLMTTLAKRLNLRLPEKQQTPSAYAELRHELGVNAGTEALRVAMEQDRILGLNNLDESADRDLPPPLDPPALQLPEVAADVKIDPIAMRVPVECFYVRFGSFSNFLWLQDTLAKWGGDAQNLVALRGLDRGMSNRIEQQLVMKQTMLSRMLGDTVIADVAIIGTDMFFNEGAAYGFLFHARSNLGLSTSLVQQRKERISQGGVKEETVEIAGRKVSYLSSPDGAVRSYYVADGDFHLITSSRRLVARFLATAKGEGSLGASPEFRYARSLMPVTREDTVWVYLSDAFFRNITGPHYRVEMARRLQATADIELVRLAKLAAAAEGRPGETIAQLELAGLLPRDFQKLPDGSRIVLENGPHDSVRGFYGSFLPIPDMPVGKITRAELAEYQRFCDYYRSEWGRMDPVIVGMKRHSTGKNLEHVVVDVLMTPFAPEHFTKLKRWLGPATDQRLAPIPGDIANLQMALTGQYVFAGLRDIGPKNGVPMGHSNLDLARWLVPGRLRELFEGYIGTTGELGVLRLLNLGIPPGADPAGFAGSPIGGWRRQMGEFTVFSFQHDVLETVVPQLRFEQAERPAQIRLRVGDLLQARIASTVNDLAYVRTRETTLNNLRLLHELDQQLHVPPQACREAAEFLLNAKLICPLGGKYELYDTPSGAPRWTSTVLQEHETGNALREQAPEGFTAPPLNWFRGLKLDASMDQKDISAHAEIDMLLPDK